MKRLPIQITPDDRESGHGFLLRALSRNRCSFSQASAWMGLRWHRCVRTQDHQLWSWITGVDSDWLLSRLPQIKRIDGGQELRLLGHRWRGSPTLRINAPQVCPACLKERGMCQSTWDLTCTPACPEHGVVLIDRCGRCKQAISWSRPTVDVCTCKHYLTSSQIPEPCNGPALKWTRWLSSRLNDPEGASRDELLPGLPASISPDGAYQIIFAMGLRTHPGQGLKPTIWSHRFRPSEVAAIIGRGMERLQSGLTYQDWDAHRQLTHEQSLERLERNGVTTADRAIAKRIRRQVFGLERKGDPALHPRGRGQLEMFLEEGRT